MDNSVVTLWFDFEKTKPWRVTACIHGLTFFFNNFFLSRRGAIVTTFIVCYALTSFSSGYVSGGFYSRSGGTDP